MQARAVIAIALSYLLGLGAFLAAADASPADPFGVVCSKSGSSPNQPQPHTPHHACCAAGVCASALLALPPQVAALAPPVARLADQYGAVAALRIPSSRVALFQARGPPSV